VAQASGANALVAAGEGDDAGVGLGAGVVAATEGDGAGLAVAAGDAGDTGDALAGDALDPPHAATTTASATIAPLAAAGRNRRTRIIAMPLPARWPSVGRSGEGAASGGRSSSVR
jgi:hypothetical protein